MAWLKTCPLLPAAHDEIVDAVGRVNFHDVPYNRCPADLDHRFWLELRFFIDPRVHPAGEDHGFHVFGIHLDSGLTVKRS
jgi:hypothetical protein